jgi:hypothetical protein
MFSYAKANSEPAKRASTGDAEHLIQKRAETPAASDAGADTESQNLNPATRSLLQLRKALDDGADVQSHLTLQRAFNKRTAKPVQRKPNATGLPDRLKTGVEHLSGLAMDDVRVHYNSPKSATMQAHAYAQGTDIHISPGQEQHLPHEAWHVVQQKQGRVKPTLQLKGVAINDDAGLEREADASAMHVRQLAGVQQRAWRGGTDHPRPALSVRSPTTDVVQRALPKNGRPDTKGLYNAQASAKLQTYKATTGRAGLDFGEHVVSHVRLKYGLSENSSNMMIATKAGSQPMSVEAAQLDHIYSWDSIRNDLHAVAAELQNGGTKSWATQDLYIAEQKKWWPTVYAARMYYNEVDNLKPMTGGANASKGANSGGQSADTKEIHPETSLLMLNMKGATDGFNSAAANKKPNELHGDLAALIASLQHMQNNLPATHANTSQSIATISGGASLYSPNVSGGHNLRPKQVIKPTEEAVDNNLSFYNPNTGLQNMD